ncbi:MAG: HAMP domain-containing sensor histidine kinase [Bacteroidota bacterium]
MRKRLNLTYWMDFTKSNTTLVATAAGVALLGLVIIQAYFVAVEIRINEQQFKRKMESILLEVHHSIEDDKSLSGQLISLFKEYEENKASTDSLLIIQIIRTVDFKIDSVLTENKLSDIAFRFVFYSTENREIIISDRPVGTISLSTFEIYSERAGSRVRVALGKGKYRFGIYFPYEFWLFINSLWFILLVSVLLIALLSLLFWGSITALKNQKQLAALKNEFINNLTHELKTPIFASSLIHNIAEKNLEEGNYKDLKSQLSLLKAENKALKGKVEKVLELSVIENGNFNMAYTLEDIHAIILKSINLYQPIVSSMKGKITYELNAQKTLVKIDKIHLGNVINNLLDNAVKYCKTFPKIRITSDNKAGMLQLTVQDFGKGIKPEDKNRVFEKFYRASQGNLHDVKGFGLGLSYVKMIVEIHNGTIQLESDPTKSTSFTISLPLSSTKLKPHAESEDIINGR